MQISETSGLTGTWKENLQDALNHGSGEIYGLAIRHLMHAQLEALTATEVVFTVVRHPALFNKSRVSLYAAAHVPTLQRFRLNLPTLQLLLVSEEASEPVINWSFLISGEFSYLKREGIVRSFLQSIDWRRQNFNTRELKELAIKQLTHIKYAELFEGMGISPQQAATLADRICEGLEPEFVEVANLYIQEMQEKNI